MPRINFIFVIHFHQPTGQLEWVLERIYNNCYRLLLDVFKMFTDMKIAVHISGPLLLELIERYPEWVNGIASLADHGTIELLGGSIGEAILPLLPREDMINQVREYNRVFERVFGFRPRGLWLPERVWEPSLPEPLARNGIEYVLVDDSTLYRGGRGGDDTLYAWITEDSGYRLKLLFIDTQLRYILPWRSHEEVFDYMISRGSEAGDRYLLWGSDAEKFGEWHDPKWAREWLIGFFTKLRTRKHEIRLMHPLEYLSLYGVRGLVYLPPGSYDKMLEWSGGFFRNFLVKYRESNNIHKKMLRVRSKLIASGVKSEEAWLNYYLGQCNDAFWHGLFGGIYLTPLRQALYEKLIKAEVYADEAMGGRTRVSIERIDFDSDGRPEIIVETSLVNAYIKPDDGGTVFEIDYKVRGFEHNIVNTMSRYSEPYLEGTGFRPDWYRRVCFREHIWAPYAGLSDWVDNTPFIDRSDLALAEYKAIIRRRSGSIVLRTIGHYYPIQGGSTEVLVEKTLMFSGNTPAVTVSYRFVNEGKIPVDGIIGIELTLAPKLPRLNREMGFVGYIVNNVDYPVSSRWSGEAEKVILRSPVMPGIAVETSGKTEYWIAPINMPSRTEKGVIENFEGIGVMPVYRAYLEQGQELKTTIKLYVEGSST